MPRFWRACVALAAIYGQLGEPELAGNALRELLALRPDFGQIGREECEKSWQPEFVSHLMDGLRKAGWRLRMMTDKALRLLDPPRQARRAGGHGSGSHAQCGSRR